MAWKRNSTRLRGASAKRSKPTVARLREANEHLVLAAVHAQHLQDDAEAANRRQNEFLAMLAHELRNPLSPISMAASLLERTPNATPQLHKLVARDRAPGRPHGQACSTTCSTRPASAAARSRCRPSRWCWPTCCARPSRPCSRASRSAARP
jgi:signal transduction histidine kinase